MTVHSKRWFFILAFVLLALPLAAKKKLHPFDIYNHEMHTSLFEAASVACDHCHADPESFTDRKKVNRLGCHLCHNNPKAPLPASNDCLRCHEPGKFEKPRTHKVDWVGRHQSLAKQNPAECASCHTNPMFCLDCHKRRDTVQERMHKRNFKFFHSIEARANPRKCDACHTVNFCQDCHAGQGRSKRCSEPPFYFFFFC